MSYNMHELPKYINTAGKITVITSILGVVIFAIIFLLNIGAKEFQEVRAQGIATTTVTVLNTPPQWTIDAQEEAESSTSTPTDSGRVVSWIATATDSNGEDYYLLICSTSTAPTANLSAAPNCAVGSVQWAVSPAASSGVQARAATTTIDSATASDFDEENIWYAWVCDGIASNARCNALAKQGTATTASPFNVNSRPTFTAFSDDSPKEPTQTVTFYATTTDPDSDPVNDAVQLHVCSTNSFSTTTNSCTATTLGTSTFTTSGLATVTYPIANPRRDQNYAAYGFVIDIHGHEATGGQQGVDSVLTVSNVAPFITPGLISIEGGSNITLTQNAGETTGLTLEFEVDDYNSCLNAASGDEVTGYIVSLYRSGIGSTTCDTTATNYNPNNCYTSAVPTSTWNLSCTASSTTCGGASDRFQTWECTFPLWYVADPTDGSATTSFYNAEEWRAAVSAIDDDGATTTSHTEGTFGQELVSFLYMALDSLSTAIPYGSLEPGQYSSPTITASTTIRAEGNVGMDELLTGESMCTYYTSAVTCVNSATSTIAESEQVYATSTITYGQATTAGNTLSSSTQKELELNVFKSTSTSTPASGVTYWGIRVPGSITLAGAYTGENTFYGKQGEPAQWQ